ncbi:PREDICTED: probable GPI-anchored adhesin-like protein PGA55 [Tarenaya hassleriana]|uniref:probable GPI-anchored adhesin-like protein PGA55 n=1 Tax=Tarenaya hassleriana TaxID=28532 RepID=UPI00053C535B|nr:PREDICTED: probable GPI-anchored adhesin-like protein PGA55 [Tarenaya hassleriana]
MNRKSSSSSSSITQKKTLSQSHPQPQLPSTKKERIPRNPLKNVNTRSSGAAGSSSNGGLYGSVSGEAPSGCVRFLLSNSCTSSSSSSSSSSGASLGRGPVKSVSKTPKSAPVVAQTLPRNKARVLKDIKLKDNVSGQQPLKCNRTTTLPRLGQSGKRPACKSTVKSNKTSALDEFSSGSRELKQKERGSNVRIPDKGAHLSPVSELGTGSGLGYGNSGKVVADGRPSNGSSSRDRTPPVQESASPEIQCGSSMILSEATKTQTCYATGHILSGISDKRKCRPKGILIVGENGLNVSKPKPLNNFDDVDGTDWDNRDSTASMMPLPADASMQWLLSPCDEEKDREKDTFNDGLYQFREVVGCEGLKTPSPLLDRSISSDICNISSGRSLAREHSGKGMRRSTGSLVSPIESSQLRNFIHLPSDKGLASAYDTTLTCEVDPSLDLKELRSHQSDKGDKTSPSSIDTLGSENVIQTPESNSSSDKYRGVSWLRAERHDLGSDFDSLTVDLQSPVSQASYWDPNSSSFQFESLAISSDSLDLSQFPRVLSNRRSCNSDSTFGNMSQTHVRISWREEINSQIPETDEAEYVNGSSVKQHTKPQRIQNTGFDTRSDGRDERRSGQIAGKETAPAEKVRQLLHTAVPCSAAESISTDGGSLIHSEDSEWMSCYKNHFLGL